MRMHVSDAARNSQRRKRESRSATKFDDRQMLATFDVAHRELDLCRVARGSTRSRRPCGTAPEHRTPRTPSSTCGSSPSRRRPTRRPHSMKGRNPAPRWPGSDLHGHRRRSLDSLLPFSEPDPDLPWESASQNSSSSWSKMTSRPSFSLTCPVLDWGTCHIFSVGLGGHLSTDATW
jgi:hypothetical protein